MGGELFETLHQRKDGSVFPVEVAAQVVDIGGARYYPAFVRDISERKTANRQLRHLMRLYALVSSTSAAIVRAASEKELFDQVCRIAVEKGAMAGAVVRIADEQARVLTAVAFSESMRAVAEQLVPSIDPSAPQPLTLAVQAYREGRVVIDNDFRSDDAARPWRTIHREAGTRAVAALPLRRGGAPIGVLVLNASATDFFDLEMQALLDEMAADISFGLDNFDHERRRVQAEQEKLESEGRFRALVEQSISGICIIEAGRFRYVNPRFAEIFGYSAQELTGQAAIAVVHPRDRERVSEIARRRESGEVASLHYIFAGIRRDGSEITVGVHGASARIEGRPVVIGMLQDISERERAKKQIEDYLRQLEQAVLDTVTAVSAMVALRDPYTSSHARRTGALAAALGAELGLAPERCRGLEVSSAVHDIGKVGIPVEILNKPGRLSALEFEVIKGHVELGHDVLKEVSFPWPLAQTILQHHERLDGSGYPGGLKGDQIIFEARILAVADVVESMASHRPYRPALGIGRALDEIETHRGARYDEQVVDACLRLFRENSYSLPN